MKLNIDTKKEKEAVSKFLQKTSDLGKKAISDIQTNALALSEKSKQDIYMRKLKKYNPLFPDVFFGVEFNIPNMIMIRDDAERRGIDVCEGSIGWLGNEGGMEVLYLYDEAVASSGLKFVTSAACDAVYYVDSYDRKKFIRVDCIFSKAHEERLAELKHIAHSLGAKKCVIEINESTSDITESKRKINLGKKAEANVEVSHEDAIEIHSSNEGKYHFDYSSNEKIQQSGKVMVELEGCDIPRKPKLKWFSNDDTIKRLIDMRMKGYNSAKSELLEIKGTSYATMSKATACSIDNALSVMKLAEKKSQGNSTMEMQVVKEKHTKLLFNIEF